jgi:hypothetical protein
MFIRPLRGYLEDSSPSVTPAAQVGRAGPPEKAAAAYNDQPTLQMHAALHTALDAAPNVRMVFLDLTVKQTAMSCSMALPAARHRPLAGNQ